VAVKQFGDEKRVYFGRQEEKSFKKERQLKVPQR
jgi:hypothetical protein